MFQFPRLPPAPLCVRGGAPWLDQGGLLHSGTLGSSRDRRSPRCFAAGPRPSSARQAQASPARPSSLPPPSRGAQPRPRRARAGPPPGTITRLATNARPAWRWPSPDIPLSRCRRDLSRGGEWWCAGHGAGPRGLPAPARAGPLRPRPAAHGGGPGATDRRGQAGSPPARSTWGGATGVAQLPRKEVIQPQLPLRLPCYDFVPVTRPALGRWPLSVTPRTSGVAGSHDVTGGVYKAREQIHRGMADPRLLATPTSRGRVAAPDPNWGRVWGLAPPRGLAAHCPGHCSVRVAQAVRAMRT